MQRDTLWRFQLRAAEEIGIMRDCGIMALVCLCATVVGALCLKTAVWILFDWKW